MASIVGGDNQYAGGLQFSSSGLMSGGAGSGFQFDLPLATVAAFNQQALNFTQANSAANRGFIDNQLQRSGASVDRAVGSSMNYIKGATDQVAATAASNATRAQAISSENQNMSLFRLFFQPKPAKGGSKCFITTAVCESEGLPDNCETLTTLRKFRDEYMLSNPVRRQMVEQYYELAPAIVDQLDALPDEGKHAYFVLRTDIDTAVARIKSGDMEGALKVYRALVEKAYRLSKG